MKPPLFFVLVLVGLTVFLTACPGNSTPDPKTFQLQVDLAGDGEGVVTSDPTGVDCGDDCDNTFNEGTTVTLTAQAGEGSSFEGFEGCTVNANTANVCTVEMDAAKTVTATFDEEDTGGDTFDLEVELAGLGIGTVTSQPSGIDCTSDIGGDCSTSFDAATSVTLTAAPTSEDSIFTGFSSNCVVDESDANICTVEVADSTEATTVTATFAASGADQFVLNVAKDGAGTGTVTSNPDGINCGTDCTETFAEATTVTLTATPDEGSEFAGFTNCVTGDTANECTVDVSNADAPIDVTASFNEEGDPSKVTLTIDSKGNGADQAVFLVEEATTGGQAYSGPIQFDPGTDVDIQVRLGATSTTNFLGWSGACTGTPSTEKCELTLAEDTDVIGIFSDGSESTANGTIAGASDDAEEYLDTNPNNTSVTVGDVTVTSGDLDFAYDTVAQVPILSGMRFTGIDLPADATILYSYIQFRADAASPTDGSGTPDNPDDDLPDVNLVISGEASDSSSTFFEIIRNLSGTGRPKTNATVAWSPAAWSQGSGNAPTKQTPDVTSIVQEITSRGGWDGAGGTGGTLTFFVEPPKDENGDYIANEQNYRQADTAEGTGTPARLIILYETP